MEVEVGEMLNMKDSGSALKDWVGAMDEKG